MLAQVIYGADIESRREGQHRWYRRILANAAMTAKNGVPVRFVLTRACGSAAGGETVAGELGSLRGDVDAIKASGVFTEDLAFDVVGQIDMVFLFQILWQFVCHELLDQPFG